MKKSEKSHSVEKFVLSEVFCSDVALTIIDTKGWKRTIAHLLLNITLVVGNRSVLRRGFPCVLYGSILGVSIMRVQKSLKPERKRRRRKNGCSIHCQISGGGGSSRRTDRNHLGEPKVDSQSRVLDRVQRIRSAPLPPPPVSAHAGTETRSKARYW